MNLSNQERRKEESHEFNLANLNYTHRYLGSSEGRRNLLCAEC
jgi:hypothetical protein